MVAGGVRLFVRSWGEGPPLYLVHGGPGGSGSYWPITTPYLGESNEVFALDLRGHGRSERRGPYSIATFADDLSALRVALGHGEAALLGHSYGALVATEAGIRDSAFSRLVLVGGFPRTPAMLAHPSGFARKLALGVRVAAWNAQERVGRRPDIRAYLVGLLKGAAPLLHAPDAPEWFDEVLFASVTDPLDAIVPLQYDLVKWNALDRLPELAARTLLIVGEHDQVAFPEAELMAERLSAARLVVARGAGHSPFLDDPSGFRSVVSAFLGE